MSILRRIADRLLENGYKPLRVGSAVFDGAYDELKRHEELVGYWQRYAPTGSGPALMVANTAVELDVGLASDAIEDKP